MNPERESLLACDFAKNHRRSHGCCKRNKKRDRKGMRSPEATEEVGAMSSTTQDSLANEASRCNVREDADSNTSYKRSGKEKNLTSSASGHNAVDNPSLLKKTRKKKRYTSKINNDMISGSGNGDGNSNGDGDNLRNSSEEMAKPDKDRKRSKKRKKREKKAKHGSSLPIENSSPSPDDDAFDSNKSNKSSVDKDSPRSMMGCSAAKDRKRRKKRKKREKKAKHGSSLPIENNSPSPDDDAFHANESNKSSVDKDSPRSMMGCSERDKSRREEGSRKGAKKLLPDRNDAAEGKSSSGSSDHFCSTSADNSSHVRQVCSDSKQKEVTSSVDDDCRMELVALERPIDSPHKKILLVLDINGLLVDINQDYRNAHKADCRLSGKFVFRRPFCNDFLQFCFARFAIGIWSSRKKYNVDGVLHFLLGDMKQNLLFCWDQAHCTTTGYMTLENKNKALVLKELKKLWNKEEPGLPWELGEYSPSNTLLVDDSPYKALCNPPHTAIFPQPYDHRNSKDSSLGPDGDLRTYLENLSLCSDVQQYVQDHPFGQPAIANTDPNWKFYHEIVDNLNAAATLFSISS